jgi:hypothetical protein
MHSTRPAYNGKACRGQGMQHKPCWQFLEHLQHGSMCRVKLLGSRCGRTRDGLSRGSDAHTRHTDLIDTCMP